MSSSSIDLLQLVLGRGRPRQAHEVCLACELVGELLLQVPAHDQRAVLLDGLLVLAVLVVARPIVLRTEAEQGALLLSVESLEMLLPDTLDVAWEWEVVACHHALLRLVEPILSSSEVEDLWQG